MPRVVVLFLTALAAALPAAAQEALSPRLRHGNTLVYLPAADAVDLRLESVRHSPVYGDPLRWRAVVGEGDDRGDGWVSLGETRSATLPAADRRLGAVALDSGQNLAIARLDGAAWAVLSRKDQPAWFVDDADLHLFPLPGREASFTLTSSVTGEGCRVRLTAGGEVLADEVGDFDEPTTFTVPAADEPRPVRLEILEPERRGLNLDDVTIALGEGFAPYLAPRPEDADVLGRRYVQWLSQNDR